jgi:hypothetical protein
MNYRGLDLNQFASLQVLLDERHVTRSAEQVGSGLIDYIQKVTAAAMRIAEKYVCAQRSYRVRMRRQSLRRPNMFSILWRCL